MSSRATITRATTAFLGPLAIAGRPGLGSIYAMVSLPKERSRVARRRRRNRLLWFPQEHGAWAWLLVPIAAGAMLAGPAWFQIPLLVCALSGYCAFNAASWWVKMPPSRRSAALPPVCVYGSVAALSGGLVIGLTGPGVIPWFVLQGLALAAAWLLTRRRAGRSLASGLSTALAATVLLLIAAHPDALARLPVDLVWPTAFIYGYLGGTVFAVKSAIRERGSVAWLVASIGWHGAWTVVAIAAQSPAWIVLWAALTVRALLLPLAAWRRALRPGVLGIVEIVAACAVLAVVAWGSGLGQLG